MAFSLTPADHVFGSHRSHGEILAKGFSAIHQSSDKRTARDHAIVPRRRIAAPVEKGFGGSVKALALRFFIYGAYSEIFARETGFNRGLGGSMHAFFTPFGIYPNNAIVGGSGSIAPGAALYQARQPQAGHRGLQHRRRLLRLRPGLGRHHLLRHGPVPHPVGRIARRRTAHPLQLHEQLLRHGRPAVRRDHGHAVHRPHRRRASIPNRCTPSASTATIRCP